jgi:hypothetical protein
VGQEKEGPKKSEMILDFLYPIYIEYGIYVYIDTQIREQPLAAYTNRPYEQGFEKRRYIDEHKRRTYTVLRAGG